MGMPYNSSRNREIREVTEGRHGSCEIRQVLQSSDIIRFNPLLFAKIWQQKISFLHGVSIFDKLFSWTTPRFDKYLQSLTEVVDKIRQEKCNFNNVRQEPCRRLPEDSRKWKLFSTISPRLRPKSRCYVTLLQLSLWRTVENVRNCKLPSSTVQGCRDSMARGKVCRI